jgi:pimeloyl-ACP methyl ester carboxylesterase
MAWMILSTGVINAQAPENPSAGDVQQIFPATRLNNDYAFRFKGKYEEKKIHARDGLILNAILFHSDSSKGVIFYLHGNTGNLEKWGKIAAVYTHLHYDIFMFDYRGYGKSEGSIRNEKQFYTDAQITYDSVKAIYSENKIVILGFSIGTGAASMLAATNKPEKLILQAPFFSLSDAIHHLAPELDTLQMPFQFNTYQYITKVSCPIVIFHGDSDKTFYYGSSKKLESLFKPGDELITLKGADHSDMEKNSEYRIALKRVLQ